MVLFKTVELEYEARLSACDGSPDPDAGGKAEWKRYGDDTERLEVKLWRLGIPDGATVYISISHRPVGSVTVSDGRARLLIEGGEGAAVPEAHEQDLLRVESGGGAVLEGTFRVD
ncbi:MAG: hypothetical protein OEQ13_02865 [Acidobacteriota bacterium]|nr:hypothetical protein [Acidobacteriota bacterium]